MKNSDYKLIYQDDEILVVNKPSGLLIAADRYDADAPRLDLLLEKDFGRLYAVHRIDKDTSGVVIYAKNADAHKNLSMQFEKRNVEKTYHALVNGHVSWEEKTVDVKLLPDGDARHRTVPNQSHGKESLTYFRNIGNCGPYAWIEAKPKTGRTHQIRIHLNVAGFCIVCDPLYSGNQKPVRLSDIKKKWKGDTKEERPLLKRLALHAYKLEIDHPKTGERMTFVADYWKDMDATRKQLASIFGVDPLAE